MRNNLPKKFSKADVDMYYFVQDKIMQELMKDSCDTPIIQVKQKSIVQKIIDDMKEAEKK